MGSLPHTSDVTQGQPLSEKGAEMRDLAVAALERRYRELADRARRRQPTAVERSELNRLEGALHALQEMTEPAAR